MIAMLPLLVILSLTSTGQANNECTPSSIRLVGGVLHNEGRLEACYNGCWGTVCGEGWTQRDAGHVCSRLGYPEEGTIMSSYGQGNGSVYNITCDGIDCRRSLVTPSGCTHSLDLGVRCQPYRAACDAEINEALSSLTTPPPVECPTIVTIDCPTPPTIMETTAIQCQCPTLPPTMNTTPVQCQYSTPPPTMETTSVQCSTKSPNNTATNRDPSDSAQIGLIFAVVVLVVALTLALTGWILTCLALKIRIYKLTKGHTHAGTPTPSETAYELNNPVYETGGGGADNTTPPPEVYEIVDEGENKTTLVDTKEDTP